MQWGHIKSLFILSFLILNIYLLMQIIEKQEEADVGILASSETTIEERLKTENITIQEDNIESVQEETYISASTKNFTSKEIDLLEEKENQQIAVINDNTIISQLDEPVSIAENATEEMIQQTIQPLIIFPEEYIFWDWNKDLHVLVFFQQLANRPVYHNQNGLLLFYLNDKNEITHYTQTMLGESKVQGDKKQLIPSIQAIEVLYNRNDLHLNEEVTSGRVGFYSRLVSDEGKQVFAPTWKITINEEKNYFVNAIEGFAFSSNDKEFLQTVMEDTIVRVQALDADSEIRVNMLEVLNKRLQKENNG